MGAIRSFAFVALLALGACATTSESGPSLRYADAASRGAWATLIAGRPSQSQVDATTENWSHALSDSFACQVPAHQVVEAAVVGALEIGAMNAAASGGSERATCGENTATEVLQLRKNLLDIANLGAPTLLQTVAFNGPVGHLALRDGMVYATVGADLDSSAGVAIPPASHQAWRRLERGAESS